MSSVKHSPSAANYSASPVTSLWPPDSDTAFWASRTAYDDRCEADAELYREWITLADELGRMPEEIEFQSWLDSLDGGPFPDECPEIPDSLYFEPEPEDRNWLAMQDAATDFAAEDALTADYSPQRKREFFQAMEHAAALSSGRAVALPDDPDKRRRFSQAMAADYSRRGGAR